MLFHAADSPIDIPGRKHYPQFGLAAAQQQVLTTHIRSEQGFVLFRGKNFIQVPRNDVQTEKQRWGNGERWQ